jgi:hypothetical protein
MTSDVGLPDGFNARLKDAYFGLEPEIHDLRHMASIAKTLLSDIGYPNRGWEWD